MSASSPDEYGRLARRIGDALEARNFGEDDFRALALEVHGFQRHNNFSYAQFCAQRGTAEKLAAWREIPAVPLTAFKRAELRAFPGELTRRTFHTSGTTGEGFGRHHFRELDLYHQAVRAGWERLGPPRLPKLVLTPSPANAPHSSLAEMMGALPGAAEFFVAADGQLQMEALDRRLALQQDSRQPVLMLGTALAFLNFFARCAEMGRRFLLPAGSLALETGGYKGSGRVIAKGELYAQFGEYLGIAAEDVVNEYGMTELSSQFYTRGLGGGHAGPPWVRVLVLDPETGGEVAVGETGVLRIFDLANLGSVLAIQTQDLAIRRAEGFELLGRDPGALPRGCSRAADERMRG